MNKHNEIETFQDFWPLYLRAHSSRVSRACHFTGLALSAATAGAMIACGMVFFLVLAVVPALLGAWLGHKLSPRHEHLADEHPDWAARADLKMFGLFLAGRLGQELDKLQLSSKPAFFMVG
jgi:hypothetical protein